MAHQASAASLPTIQQKTRRKVLSIFTANLPTQQVPQEVSCRSSLNGTPAYYSTLMAQNPFWVVPPTEPTLRPANDLRS